MDAETNSFPVGQGIGQGIDACDVVTPIYLFKAGLVQDNFCSLDLVKNRRQTLEVPQSNIEMIAEYCGFDIFDGASERSGFKCDLRYGSFLHCPQGKFFFTDVGKTGFQIIANNSQRIGLAFAVGTDLQARIGPTQVGCVQFPVKAKLQALAIFAFIGGIFGF